MKGLPTPKLNRQILDEASEWFVDFRVGDVDSAARARFDEWLRRSPEHIRAYWEIAKTYVELPSAVDSGSLDVAALISYAHSNGNVIPFSTAARPGETYATDGASERLDRPARTRVGSLTQRRRFLTAAACAAALVAGGAAWWQNMRYPLYSTDIGERRSLTLADGSTVDMNSHSSIRVEFSATERRIEMRDGQALFQVVKDKSRPFIVQAGAATVRAVGTQFDVYRKHSGTTVTVLEGRVAIYARASLRSPAAAGASQVSSAPHSARRPEPGAAVVASRGELQDAPTSWPSLPQLADPAQGAALYLSAGEQVTVTERKAPTPQRVDLASATAWTQRRLIFDDTKLADVADEFNRYNHRQLVIEGDELADVRISGVYSSTDPTSLLRFLSEQPGVKVTEERDRVRIATH
jgi:transmembrane sensor